MQEKIPEISGPTTQSTSLLFLQQLSSQIGDLGVRPWVIHPKDGP